MAQAIKQAPIRKPLWRPATREALTGWLFASPWVIGFIVFTLGPMIFSAYASFTNYSITNDPVWIGTDNYTNLFNDPRFYQSLGNTFWMVIIKIPLVTVASIGIALLLNMELPGGKFFRTVF